LTFWQSKRICSDNAVPSVVSPCYTPFQGGLWGMRLQGIVAATCVAAILGACMGRTPDPVAVVQAQDQTMGCTGILAEIQANNAKVQQLAKDNGWKVAQNVAAGVGGLLIWPLWFAMDFQGTADKEAAALQARQQYLAQLAAQKRCGGPSRT
ncbi:MAG TPA: hypothetical protein VMX97_08965, partial [Hyphomicrobiaceae bacterium]|nr:hypothetical protein [Hyphomicrobiaceae bacterium]